MLVVAGDSRQSNLISTLLQAAATYIRYVHTYIGAAIAASAKFIIVYYICKARQVG